MPNFRMATESDLPTLLGFMRQLYVSDPGPKPLDEAGARAALEQFLGDASLGRAWLICDRETPVGYAVLTLGYSLEYLGRDAFVDEIFIAESHRGRGWGRRALELVENTARELGVRALHLEASHTNREAHGMYRHVGYEDHERWLMTKWL